MTYERGERRRQIVAFAKCNGWTVVELSFHEMEIVRRDSIVWLVWTVSDTLAYASFNMQGFAGCIPADPRMRLMTVREWLAAPGVSNERTSTNGN